MTTADLAIRSALTARPWWRAVLLAVVAALLLAACTGGDDEAGDSGAESGVAADMAVEEAAGGADSADRAEGVDGTDGAALTTAAQVTAPGDVRDRQVIRTARATVVVDDGGVDAALTAVLRVADRYEAVVTSSTTTGTGADGRAGSVQGDAAGPQPPYTGPLPQPPPGDGVRATVTLGVPSGALDTVLAALDDVGDVTGRSVSSEEVTAEFIDLEARRDNLADQAEFYRGLLDQTDDVEDAIAVREQLDAIVTEKEQVEGRLRYLQTRVAFSQLTVSLVEASATSTAPTGVGEQLADAVGQGASVALSVLTGMIVVLGAVAPLAAVAALVAAAVWGGVVAVRRLRRRRDAAATTH